MSAYLSDLIEPLQPFAQSLVQLAGRAGVQPRVTSTRRTHSEQKRLYAAFQRGETHYPVAPPGRSAHEFGWAFDMVAATVEDLHDLGTVWVNAGGIWSPQDEVHFEYPGFSAPALPEEAEPSATTPGFWEQFVAGLPIAFWPSILLSLLGVPTVAYARTPRHEAYLRKFIHDNNL